MTENKKSFWPVGIAASLAVFMMSMILFLYYALNQNNDLVRKDYYEHDLQFDVRKSKIQAAEQDSVVPVFTLVEPNVGAVFFPGFANGEHSGEIYFYRPSSSEDDIRMRVNPDEKGFQFISWDNKPKGNYDLIVDWKVGDKSYYSESRIYIP